MFCWTPWCSIRFVPSTMMEAKNNDHVSIENMRTSSITKAAYKHKKKRLWKGSEKCVLLSISPWWTKKEKGFRSASVVDIGRGDRGIKENMIEVASRPVQTRYSVSALSSAFNFDHLSSWLYSSIRSCYYCISRKYWNIFEPW